MSPSLRSLALSCPPETQAVRITRTMERAAYGDQLKWSSYMCGVEVTVDGELIYSDFPGAEHDADGFVRSPRQWAQRIIQQREQWLEGLDVRASLPADRSDVEVSVTTYFPPDWNEPGPVFPLVGNSDARAISMTVSSVLPMAAATVSALLALLLAGIYLMDISNGRADGRTLLLCLYFLLLFLNRAYNSNPGYYSVLTKWLDIGLLQEIYIAPLYLYMALRQKKPWNYVLCGTVGVWALCEGILLFLNARRGMMPTEGRSGLAAFVLFLVFAVLFCVRVVREQKKRPAVYLLYGIFAVAAIWFCAKNQAWEHGIRTYLRYDLLMSLANGNFMPTVSLVTRVSAMMASVVLVTEFVYRTLHTRQEMSALEERGRQTMASYERVLAAEDATRALHHEMRHHMTALSAILKSGDLERAASYADTVAGELDMLPEGRYSRNVLVNVVAGSYLDRAKSQGVRVEHRLNVPPELHIADEDLSVFLSNMLQNALEACQRIGPEKERYIRVDMQLRGNFLFIQCVNSAPDEDGQRKERSRRGYGLAAMRRVAEKYNSVLAIERTPGAYSVMSDLCLHQGEPEDQEQSV